MLVLSRKPSQKVFINGTIEIRVLETRGKTVKLGFVCPPDVAVHREEVLQRIHADANGEGKRHAPTGFTGNEESWADATFPS
jgi:carbon storage regulator